MAKKARVLKGVIFDLDGVIVNTVPLHFKAWKRMFAEYGTRFSLRDYEKKVDGIPRLDGARAILTDLNSAELERAAELKQRYYLRFLKKEGARPYKSGLRLIADLRRRRIKVAVISSSRNCRLILRKAGLIDRIDAVVAGNDVRRGKPHPDIFLLALRRLRLRASECIVFEDAVLGVEAAKRAGIFTIGVDRRRGGSRLEKADFLIRDLRGMSYHRMKGILQT